MCDVIFWGGYRISMAPPGCLVTSPLKKTRKIEGKIEKKKKKRQERKAFYLGAIVLPRDAHRVELHVKKVQHGRHDLFARAKPRCHAEYMQVGASTLSDRVRTRIRRYHRRNDVVHPRQTFKRRGQLLTTAENTAISSTR